VAGSALTPHQPIALNEDYPAQHPPVIDTGLAARLRKERPKPVNLRLGQPEKIAPDAAQL
jgi:hypothetical protein